METTYEPEIEENIRKEHDRLMVQEGSNIWRKQKEEIQRQKHIEQREMRRIQSSYWPWGRPGGGAPFIGSLRKKNVILEPLKSSGTCQYLDRFGRPGPGGIPWRDPRLLGFRFFESLGWTDKSFIQRLHSKEINDMNSFFDDNSHKGNNYKAQTPAYNEEIQLYKLTGGVELVPLMTSKKCYSPERLKNLNNCCTDHIAALTEQIRWKQGKLREEKRLEQERCRRHFETWSTFWGRPGHGAPLYKNYL